jgi:cyclopropane fatty-acyl-phospholipid synthase-like methyltransferase
MATVGAPDIENFLVVGEAWFHVASRFLAPGETVLDIGCGCGRTARFLLASPGLRYVGFDIFKPSIDWCSVTLAPLSSGRFAFFHYDGASEHYNPQGTVPATGYRFPAETESVHLAIGASIFPHLKEQDAEHYLGETHRVLRPGGRALFSIHTTPAEGRKYSGQEDRVDIEPAYFVEMNGKAGLELREDLGELCGQEAFVFEKGV